MTRQSDIKSIIFEHNREFYEKYKDEYFLDKAHMMLSLMANAEEHVKILNNGFEIGKIKANKGDYSTSEILEIAKKELVVNSYHCIETLFRLLIAHIRDSQTPWIGVEQIRNFRKFKEDVSLIIDKKFFLNSHDEEISKIFFGVRESFNGMTNVEWEKNIKNTNELLQRFGNELLELNDYNTHKHGAALINTEFGVRLGDGSIIDADLQDTFMYITSKIENKSKEKTEIQINKTFKFMKWEEKYANTYFATQLIKNMLNISRLKLGITKEAKLSSLHTLDVTKIFKTGIVLNTMDEPLFQRVIVKNEAHRT